MDSIVEPNNVNTNKKRSKTNHVCNYCNFTTSKKYNYDKHIVSLRHMTNITTLPENVQHMCKKCNRKYTCYSGLWRHNKTCLAVAPEDPVLLNKVDKLQEQVQNLTELINRMMKEGKNDNITNSHSNNASNNNSSNNNNCNNLINNVIIMLNEKCSNAANIKDVIAAYTQTIGLAELKQIEHSNYVEGAAALATQALNVTNPLERSLYHVPDEKLSYVRDENTWKYEKKDNMPIIEGTIDILCEGIDKKITKQYSKRSTIEQKRIGIKLEHKKKNEPAVKKKIVENVLQTSICNDDTLKLE